MIGLWKDSIYPIQLFGGQYKTERLHSTARDLVFRRLSVPLHDTAKRNLIGTECLGGAANAAAYSVGCKLQEKAWQRYESPDDKVLHEHDVKVNNARAWYLSMRKEPGGEEGGLTRSIDTGACSFDLPRTYLSPPNSWTTDLSHKAPGEWSGWGAVKDHEEMPALEHSRGAHSDQDCAPQA
jgi:hypothetical protein